MQQVPLTRDLVLVGGGHAHALVLKAWGMDPLPGARLTVINPGPTAPYTGMLPGHVAGHYDRDLLEIDLMRLCRHAGARLILDRAVGIDRASREVRLAAGGPVAYDVASIDIGITAQMALPGFEAHGIAAKPLDRYAARWRAFLAEVKAGHAAPQVAVIGGGVAGVELAMAMAHALRQAGAVPEVAVIEASAALTGIGARARRHLLRQFAALGIRAHLQARVLRIEADRVLLADQPPVPAAFCVGAAGAFPHDWIGQTDLPQREGFIEVGSDLGVTGDPALFAVGDCAVMPHAPRPKAGVFAVRAAPVLHNNLRAALGAGKRRVFRPQRQYLKLISLGGKSALAEKYGVALSGPFLWRWKDRIDRAFMRRLGDLPPMENDAPQGPLAADVRQMMAARPLCGGCGAKVGGAVLSGALRGIEVQGSEVITGPGDDAAVLRRPGGGYQVISTDHLLSLLPDPIAMTRIAAVHALGDVWSMGAGPQVALAHVILPQMSATLQARTLGEITRTARQVLEAEGAELVGGHTTMGAELTIGFTVTGTRDSLPIGLDGARAGDWLVLTKPLGTGILMAAEMAALADGRDVFACLGVMQQGQGAAASALAGAHAMTDVTGFGLAGHLTQICRASGLDAELWQDQLPVYPGVRALIEAGVSSVLMPVNRADAPVLGVDDPLLFDPQTAGGLLAALPEDAARKALARLGEDGHLIGQLHAGAGQITLKSSR